MKQFIRFENEISAIQIDAQSPTLPSKSTDKSSLTRAPHSKFAHNFPQADPLLPLEDSLQPR